MESEADGQPVLPGARSDATGVPDFCRTCGLFHTCAMVGYGKPELSPLHGLMQHLGPFRAGDVVLRQGDPFDAVFALRAGALKIRQIDRDGREHVLDFYLPGEVVGLGAIYPGAFPYDAVALDDVRLCRFPFAAISALATRQPAVQQHLFRLISQKLGVASRLILAGELGADERIAAFLVDLSQRYDARGLSGTRFRLSMSRADIANYLRLAAETVSRAFTRFRDRGLITVTGRSLELRDPQALRRLGHVLLG